MNAKNITEILDALAARFGSTGTHLWEVLVRQQAADAMRGFLFSVMVIAFGSFGVRLGRKQKADGYIEWFLPMMFGLAAIVAGVGIVGYNVAILYNPEYYALGDVVKLVTRR